MPIIGINPNEIIDYNKTINTDGFNGGAQRERDFINTISNIQIPPVQGIDWEIKDVIWKIFCIIAMEEPFCDGNKRTSSFAINLLLEKNYITKIPLSNLEDITNTVMDVYENEDDIEAKEKLFELLTNIGI